MLTTLNILVLLGFYCYKYIELSSLTYASFAAGK